MSKIKASVDFIPGLCLIQFEWKGVDLTTPDCGVCRWLRGGGQHLSTHLPPKASPNTFTSVSLLKTWSCGHRQRSGQVGALCLPDQQATASKATAGAATHLSRPWNLFVHLALRPVKSPKDPSIHICHYVQMKDHLWAIAVPFFRLQIWFSLSSLAVPLY